MSDTVEVVGQTIYLVVPIPLGWCWLDPNTGPCRLFLRGPGDFLKHVKTNDLHGGDIELYSLSV